MALYRAWPSRKHMIHLPCVNTSNEWHIWLMITYPEINKGHVAMINTHMKATKSPQKDGVPSLTFPLWPVTQKTFLVRFRHHNYSLQGLDMVRFTHYNMWLHPKWTGRVHGVLQRLWAQFLLRAVVHVYTKHYQQHMVPGVIHSFLLSRRFGGIITL